jgi:hypothetical protein
METQADKHLAEGEFWSEPLFKDSKPSRWEDTEGERT